MLACNICNQKAKYRVIIDCGRFSNKLFFCEKHKPQSMVMGAMDEKQHDTNINTLLTTLTSSKVIQKTAEDNKEFLKRMNIEIFKLFENSEDFIGVASEVVKHWIDTYYKLMMGEIDTTNTYQKQKWLKKKQNTRY